MMKTTLLFLLCGILVSIECRRSLRDYVVSQNSFNGLGTNDYSVYDPRENSLLCRLQPLNNGLNLSSNLIIYPSRQKIALITNIWSPFSKCFSFPSSLALKILYLVYQSYINVLDDQLNRWVKGQIYQVNRSEDFRCIIKYGTSSFLMENKFGSLITEIRDQKRQNYVLSRFYQTYFDPYFGLSRYNIQIYTDDLPDPIYILALSALDSRTMPGRVRFIP